MRLSVGLLGLTLWVGLTGAAAFAQERGLAVVELFTSQGCSSCPPADEILNKLAARDDVLALSLHVDYWDYIGWPDRLARPEHTDRQKAYSYAAGMRSIYTPQMIIAGTDHVIGSRPMEIADLISAYHAQPSQVSLTAESRGSALHIAARSITHMPLPDKINVVFVTFTPVEDVEIKRGENAGRHMRYSNVVTGMQVIAIWDGQGAMAQEIALASLGVPAGADLAGQAAVFLQIAGPGEILAAARLR